MSSAKRDDARPSHRWSKRERLSASRRGRERLVVRWIGAAKRRASKAVATASIEVSSAQIIRLSWVDTFGRRGPSLPTRCSHHTDVVAVGMAGWSQTLMQSRDQPSVPDLR